MLVTDKYGEKLDLSFLALEERDLLNLKLQEIKNLQILTKKIDWDSLESEDVPKISLFYENFKNLMKRANATIDRYVDFCNKARTRLIVEIGHFVKESDILEKTKDYPGLDIFYKTAQKIKDPDYIYALMQQTVLKQRELNKSLAKAILKNKVEFTYAELETMDEGAAALALQRAFMKVSDVLAGRSKPDIYKGEFCFIQSEGAEYKAVFISVAKKNNNQPNLNLVKSLLNATQIVFDANSESRLDSETEVKINCGSVSGTPVPIAVKVPYFLRSYIIKKYK